MSDQLVKPITTCRICNQQFANRPMDIPIIGEPASAATERFVMALAGHLQKKHREVFDQIAGQGKLHIGYLALCQFESQDKALLDMREMVRYDLHRTTSRVNITDEHIGNALAELGIDMQTDDRQKIEGLIKDLRDLLTDSGPYSPKVNSPLVPVNA